MTSRLLILLLSFVVTSSHAQSIVRSTIGSVGGSLSNEQLFIQQTIGQSAAIDFVERADGAALRQGFHQPFYSVRSDKGDLEALVFPNPSQGLFEVVVDLPSTTLFLFQLTDSQGKLLEYGEGSGNQPIPFDLMPKPAGVYNLFVKSADQSSSFKIILTE